MTRMANASPLRNPQSAIRNWSKDDLVGGLLAFCAAAPALFATASLLELANIPNQAAFTGCCLAAGAATMLLSSLCRLPVVFAPSVGLASLFTFTLYLGAGIPRETVLGVYALSGLCLLILGALRVGPALLRAVPDSLHPAVMAGIGLLLIGTGLRQAGIVVAHPVTLVVLGNVTARAPLIAGIGGLAICLALARRIPYPLAVGAAVAVLSGLLLGVVPVDWTLITPMWAVMGDIPIDPDRLFDGEALRFLPSILLIVSFETAGVFAGLRGFFGPNTTQTDAVAGKLWIGSGIAACLSPLLGVPGPVLSPEGLVGGAAGGRTRLAGLVTGALFLISPLVPVLGRVFGGGYQVGPDTWLHPIMAPVLVFAGLQLLVGLRRVDWERLDDALPAGVVCAITPLTFSLVNGLSLGLIAYAVIRVARGDLSGLRPIYGVLIPLLVLRYLVL